MDCGGGAKYRGEQNPWVKGSVCLFIEFELPPFSPPLPSVVQFSKCNMNWTFDIRINFTPPRSVFFRVKAVSFQAIYEDNRHASDRHWSYKIWVPDLIPGAFSNSIAHTVFPSFLGSRFHFVSVDFQDCTDDRRHPTLSSSKVRNRDQIGCRFRRFPIFLYFGALRPHWRTTDRLPCTINYGGDNALAPMGKEGRIGSGSACMSKRTVYLYRATE